MEAKLAHGMNRGTEAPRQGMGGTPLSEQEATGTDSTLRGAMERREGSEHQERLQGEEKVKGRL